MILIGVVTYGKMYYVKSAKYQVTECELSTGFELIATSALDSGEEGGVAVSEFCPLRFLAPVPEVRFSCRT